MATQAIISAPWLDKVVINSGHQHLRVGPDRQPSLVPPDEKAAVRRICVARSPGATILGVSFSASPVNHPVSVPPTGYVVPSQCTRWQVLYVRTGSLSGLQFTTLRRLCGQLLWQQQKGQHPEGGCWSGVSGEQEAEGR